MSYRIGLKSGDKLIPRKIWQIPNSLKNAISLIEYCKNNYYSRNAVMRRIQLGQVQGFKIGRRWYVIQPPK